MPYCSWPRAVAGGCDTTGWSPTMRSGPHGPKACGATGHPSAGPNDIPPATPTESGAFWAQPEAGSDLRNEGKCNFPYCWYPHACLCCQGDYCGWQCRIALAPVVVGRRRSQICVMNWMTANSVFLVSVYVTVISCSMLSL